jgi:hypothetical protein
VCCCTDGSTATSIATNDYHGVRIVVCSTGGSRLDGRTIFVSIVHHWTFLSIYIYIYMICGLNSLDHIYPVMCVVFVLSMVFGDVVWVVGFRG